MEELNSWVEFLRKDMTEVVSASKQLGSIYISALPSAQNLPLLECNTHLTQKTKSIQCYLQPREFV
jgi:hypothetical protein